MPTTGSGSGFSFCVGRSRRCRLGLLGKGLLVSQWVRGCWFRGEACLIPVDCHSCKNVDTEKGQNGKTSCAAMFWLGTACFQRQHWADQVSKQAKGVCYCRNTSSWCPNMQLLLSMPAKFLCHISGNSAKHDDLAIINSCFFNFIYMNMKKN